MLAAINDKKLNLPNSSKKDVVRLVSFDGYHEYLIHWPGFDKGQEKFAYYCASQRFFTDPGSDYGTIMSLSVEQTLLMAVERNTNSCSFDVIKSVHLSLLSNSLVGDHDFTLAMAYLMEINAVISHYYSIT